MSSVESHSPPSTPEPYHNSTSLQPHPASSIPPLQPQHNPAWTDTTGVDLDQAGPLARHRQTPTYTARNHRQTLAEFLQDEQPAFRPQALSREERRQSMVAMDRKRRLTSSTNDGHGRRAAHGFPESLRDGAPPSPVRRSHSENNTEVSREVIDLTSPSPESPALTRPRRPMRDSSSSYTVPRWQPDAEVSECPICHRPFTWMFRRHHCRKCGRVVCNDCSPHRITIPRQYIVQPPGFEEFTPATLSSASGQPATIDLTHEDGTGSDSDEGNHRRMDPFGSHRRSLLNPALGGGEKVRLCNPCVPDPQPISQPGYPPHASPNQPVHTPRNESAFGNAASLSLSREAPSVYQSLPSHLPRPRASSHQDAMRPPGSLAWRSSVPRPGIPTSVSAQSRLQGGQSPGLPQGMPPPPPHPSRRDYPVPPLPGGMPRQFGASGITLSGYGHGRYHSLNVPRRSSNHWPMQSGAGSSVDTAALQRFIQEASSSRPVPRLREEDICPVCRRALPPRGADGDETAREAHVMQCISARQPSSAGRQPGAGSAASTIGIISFIATEKDCVGEDGNRQECSICMVEYDVGDSLARLECWCKFHRECIVEWFTRKQECPVHRLQESQE